MADSTPDEPAVSDTPEADSVDGGAVADGGAGGGTPADTAAAARPPTDGDGGRNGAVRLVAGVAALALAGGVGYGIGIATSDDDDGPRGREVSSERDRGRDRGDERDRGRERGHERDRDREVPDFPGSGGAEWMQLSDVFAGTVEDVGDEQLTIDTGSGDAVEVAIDDDTVVTDTTEADVDDLEVGDAVRIAGTPADGAAIEATEILASDDEDLLAEIAGPGFGRYGGEIEARPGQPDWEEIPGEVTEDMPEVFSFFPLTAGTIESIDGDTISITTEDGDTVEVTTSSSTTVRRISEISWDDLEPGDEVTVFAEDDDGTLTATSVRRGEDAFLESMPPIWESEDDAPDAGA